MRLLLAVILCVASSPIVACGQRPQSAEPAPEASSACSPTWVYLKDHEAVERHREIDIGERDVVLIGCSDHLTSLSLDQKAQLEQVFDQALPHDEPALRALLKNDAARAGVVALANDALGERKINDFYIDFWIMAF